MKIIVESGATKTAWRAISVEGNMTEVLTPGLSPTCLDAEYISDIVRKAVPALNPDGKSVEQIVFYGAGLVSEESTASLRSCLEMWCPFASVEFHSDILAAARALFGDGSGVVAIMGTGSNSCLYRDGKIIRNYRPGGFILGDDGSAASLGKAFMSDVVRSLTPANVYQLFREEYDLPYQNIVENVYRKPGAAAFLGSFAPFILKNIDEPSGYFRSLVEGCIDAFMR
jgi:N-acetylglucosamine kinase-like BadF-type ATPase